MKRRLLSVFLSLCMILTLAPAAFAAEPDDSAENTPVEIIEAETDENTQEPATNEEAAPTEPAESTEPAAPATPAPPTDPEPVPPTDGEQADDAGTPAEETAPDTDEDKTEEPITEAEDASPAGTEANPFTTVEQYNAAVAHNAKKGEDVYLTIKGTQESPIIFGTNNAAPLTDNSKKYGTFEPTNTQSWADPPKLHLTLEWCEFYGNTANDPNNSSFMYLPNCQSLTIENCKFDTGASSLKYGINWNLCGIQDSVVSITDSTFTGNYQKNALKLNQRNGTDDKANDVKLPNSPKTPAASIKSVNISNCTFSGTNAVIQLGSQGKGADGAAAPSTGAFPVTIFNVKAGEGEGESAVKVELAYLAANGEEVEIPSIELSANKTASKTAKGDLGTEGDFVAKVGEDGYISLKTALDAAIESEGTVTLQQDVTADITIPAGSTLTIDGNGKTLYGTINCAVTTDANVNTDLTVKGLTLDGDTNQDESADKTILLNSMKQDSNTVSGLNLTMTDCTVKNSKSEFVNWKSTGGQGLYLTNAKNLTIDGCTFTNCGGVNYAIDLNLVAVQDAVISITNTKFEGNCGTSGPIKVAERGAGDGTEAPDITGGRASVNSLTISGCTFNNPNPVLGGDIVLGVKSKGGEKNGNDTGSFPVTIFDNKTTSEGKQLKIKLAYTDATAKDITASVDSTVIGNGETEPAVGYTITATAGAGGSITPSGKVAVAKNGSQAFTVDADSGYSISDVAISDGAEVVRNADGTYVVQKVTKDCTITATFSKNSSTGGGSSSGGGGSSSGSYAITVDKTTGGTVKVTPSRANKGDTVTITVDPKSGYELDKLVVTDKNGDSIRLREKGSDKYTFTMPSGKVTVEATFTRIEQQDETISFTDVSTSAYYYDAVKWAVEQGITSGTSATTFSPNANCTRAQMVTFLWRANGSPKAAGSNPFTDVDSGAYYYDAVLWAVQKGITSGTSATTFAPDAAVTRGQTVTFLYRANNSPAVTGANPFTDVAADAFCNAAVQWAAQEGITSGTSATTFEPGSACTRAQIVTFMFRDMVK